MLKEFAAKKCVKLGKLLERGGLGVETRRKGSGGSNPMSKIENCPVKASIFNVLQCIDNEPC